MQAYTDRDAATVFGKIIRHTYPCPLAGVLRHEAQPLVGMPRGEW